MRQGVVRKDVRRERSCGVEGEAKVTARRGSEGRAIGKRERHGGKRPGCEPRGKGGKGGGTEEDRPSPGVRDKRVGGRNAPGTRWGSSSSFRFRRLGPGRGTGARRGARIGGAISAGTGKKRKGSGTRTGRRRDTSGRPHGSRGNRRRTRDILWPGLEGGSRVAGTKTGGGRVGRDDGETVEVTPNRERG